MTSDDRFSFLVSALLASVVVLGASQMWKAPDAAPPDAPVIGRSAGSAVPRPSPIPESAEAESRDPADALASERIAALFGTRPWPEFARSVVFHPLTEKAIANGGLEEGIPFHVVISPDGAASWTPRGVAGSKAQPPGLPADATRALHVAMPDCLGATPEALATVRALWRSATVRFGAHGALFADEVTGSTVVMPAGFDRSRCIAQQETRKSATRPRPATQPAASAALAKIRFGSTTIDAGIASTMDARVTGLSNRTELKKNEGLLFVYREADDRSFWMKGCKIALDIIFLKDDGQVLSVTTMQPPEPGAIESTLPRAKSPEKCRLVLEVAGGLSQQMGVKAGSQLGLPDSTAKLFERAEP